MGSMYIPKARVDSTPREYVSKCYNYQLCLSHYQLCLSQLQSFAEDGFVNIVGGCCGSTPAHIRFVGSICLAAAVDFSLR
jgi:S-methylmethionine-dependent homocysteine/selenocysteine methylase